MIHSRQQSLQRHNQVHQAQSLNVPHPSQYVHHGHQASGTRIFRAQTIATTTMSYSRLVRSLTKTGQEVWYRKKTHQFNLCFSWQEMNKMSPREITKLMVMRWVYKYLRPNWIWLSGGRWDGSTVALCTFTVVQRPAISTWKYSGRLILVSCGSVEQTVF